MYDRPIVVFGVGEGAKLATSVLRRHPEAEIACYTVDRHYLNDETFEGRDVVPYEDLQDQYPASHYDGFLLLGYDRVNEVRAARYKDFKGKGYRLINLVDPRNDFDYSALTGDNCFIQQHQLIHDDVRIGSNVVLWSGCHIGERSVIGDHTWLGGHVCVNGDVEICDQATLGSNCTIAQHATVGTRSFIGAGALINQSVEPDSVHIVQQTPSLGISSERYMKVRRKG